MIKIVLLLQVVGFLNHVNGFSALQPRVIGGHAALSNSAPFIVSVQHGTDHICGGAIISSKFVITSATCILFYNPTTILAGSQKLFTNLKRYTVDYWLAHEDFSVDTQNNDLGLLKIVDTFVYTSKVKSIPINTNFNLKSNSVTDFYGWGYLDAENLQRPNDLQVVYQKLLINSECQLYYRDNALFTHNHICAMVKAHQGACNEDIGGPLVLDGTLIGILNWVTNCGTGKPDVFLNIANYYDWINRQLEEPVVVENTE